MLMKMCSYWDTHIFGGSINGTPTLGKVLAITGKEPILRSIISAPKYSTKILKNRTLQNTSTIK